LQSPCIGVADVRETPEAAAALGADLSSRLTSATAAKP